MNHKLRDDVSRFLVHLTRAYGGYSAEDNLLSILRSKKLEARNVHCLFHHKFKQYGFSKLLQDRFRTVCLTEAPIPQIRYLAMEIPKRRIRLQPYGLVFRKQSLMHQGASPAIYLNAKGTELSNYLLREFQRHFADHNTVKLLKKDYTDEADSIIQYYALINTISDRFDFSWEREWRFPGDLAFNYMDVYAIVAPNPRKFLLRCERRLTPKAYKLICRIPIVSPDWNYERILHEFAVKLWNAD